jgi:D-xylose reductase
MSLLNGVNVLGFGTWKLPANSSTSDLIYKIIREGYRHIDCASIYGNEKYVGEGIQRALQEGIVKREDLWITSKLYV